MKKIYTILFTVLLTVTVFAQAPEKMSYQAVVRDASNNLVTSTSVGMQISILQGSVDGTPIYIETQTTTTNANGLVSIEIGTGTTSDDFSAINWANSTYYIKTETDPTGGTNYTITGTSQLLSVPYALHAKTAESLINANSETLIIPASGQLNSSVDVSFSGGSNVIFSEASPVAIQFSQATSLLYPSNFYYINEKRVDAEFLLYDYIGTGTFDVIINPTSSNPIVIEEAILVFDNWDW